MSKLSATMNAPEIVCSDTLGQVIRNIIEISRAYDTIILLYEDDFANKIHAAWAEKDRLHLQTRPIGYAFNGIEVHSFGLDDFKEGTVLELALRESNQDANRESTQRKLYRSILNELSQIQVKVYQNGRGNLLLQ